MKENQTEKKILKKSSKKPRKKKSRIYFGKEAQEAIVEYNTSDDPVVRNKIYGDRIPQSTISKPPSAELAPDQVDPFDYEIVSHLVDEIVEDHKSPVELIANGNDQEIVNDLYYRIRKNEYKRRQAAPGLRVSAKAFGAGRRIPIVNHFEGK